MTIQLSPNQERAIQQAIESGLFRSVDEFIETAIANIPQPNTFSESSRREAVERMVEFVEKYHLSLGEPVTRKFLARRPSLLMAEFVLDASIAFSWCFPGDPTEDSDYSRRILQRLGTDNAVVPEIWAFEIANSIFVSLNKRKRVSQIQIDEYLRLLKALPIRVEPLGLWLNVDL